MLVAYFEFVDVLEWNGMLLILCWIIFFRNENIRASSTAAGNLNDIHTLSGDVDLLKDRFLLRSDFTLKD